MTFFYIVCKDVFICVEWVMKFVKYEFNNVKIEICKIVFCGWNTSLFTLYFSVIFTSSLFQKTFLFPRIILNLFVPLQR